MASPPTSPTSFVRALFRLRVVRYALVGGIGIPINIVLLWFFHGLLHMPIVPAWICAFEPSSLINFYANQRFTYHEQTHVRGWDWPIRALKAQATSLTGLAVNVAAFSALLKLGIHYLPADAAGIVAAFAVNFVIANRFVFTAAHRHTDGSALGTAEFEGVA
ncbi:MAG TPA: GtrA family protein [Chloroflexota bacterium]|nr:GtrA family protein [Chloroflexota bacterium]